MSLLPPAGCRSKRTLMVADFLLQKEKAFYAPVQDKDHTKVTSPRPTWKKAPVGVPRA